MYSCSRLLVVAAILGGASHLSAAQAGTETVLYTFGDTGAAAAKGHDPSGPLAMDQNGVLYGTTRQGGNGGGGVVFKYTPGAGYVVLHHFADNEDPAAAQGSSPNDGVVLGPNGVLYGTTSGGGTGQIGTVRATKRGGTVQGGTVYKLTPPIAGGAWTHTVLYNFTDGPGMLRGYRPAGGLVIGQGALYGTTESGGPRGGGTVYKLTPSAGGRWTHSLLYGFASSGPLVTKGRSPLDGVIRDDAGVLYGTTRSGGTRDLGTVFKLTPPTGSGAWTHTVLRSFATADGIIPLGGLVRNGAVLYGTTQGGGPHVNGGTVFKLTTAGTGFAVLLEFEEGASMTVGAIGGNPAGGLIRDASNVLWGTTVTGGPRSGGVVFRLVPGGAATIPFAFASSGPLAAKGYYPRFRLVRNAQGHLFGTTQVGASGPTGAMFKVVP